MKVLAYLLFAFLIRIKQTVGMPVYSDEYFTSKIAGQPDPLSVWLQASGGDIYSPGFYWLAWLTRHIGDHVFWLRLPAMLASVGCIWASGRIAERFGGTKAKWIAMILTTFLPLGFYYGLEAKPYTLLAFFSLMAFDAAYVIAKGSKAPLMLWAACMMWTFWLAPFALIAIALGFKDRRVNKTIFYGALTALPLLPFFIKTCLTYQDIVNEGFWMLPLLSLHNFMVGFWSRDFIWILFFLYGSFILWPNRRTLKPLISLAFTPICLAWITFVFVRPSYSDRAMLVSAYALMILFAVQFSLFKGWALATSLFLAMQLSNLCAYVYGPSRRAEFVHDSSPCLEVHAYMHSALPNKMVGNNVRVLILKRPDSKSAGGTRELWRKIKKLFPTVETGLDSVYATKEEILALNPPCIDTYIADRADLMKQNLPSATTLWWPMEPGEVLNKDIFSLGVK